MLCWMDRVIGDKGEKLGIRGYDPVGYHQISDSQCVSNGFEKFSNGKSTTEFPVN